MWLIILCLCVELLCKNKIFRRVKTLKLREKNSFQRRVCFCEMCVTFCMLCVFCGFVCRVLRNGASVSKTVCKHFGKTVIRKKKCVEC